MIKNQSDILKPDDKYPTRFSLYKGFTELPPVSKIFFTAIKQEATRIGIKLDFCDLVRFYWETYDTSIVVNSPDTPDEHYHIFARTFLWHYAFPVKFKPQPIVMEFKDPKNDRIIAEWEL